MFILDTNIISDLRRPEKTDPRVISWVSSLPLSSSFISVITVLELERGVRLMEQKDTAQGTVLRSWLDCQVLPGFEGRILEIDTNIARCCANLHVPDPRSERDALIAATALVHHMTVVTRNIADFEPMGVKIFNPWKET